MKNLKMSKKIILVCLLGVAIISMGVFIGTSLFENVQNNLTLSEKDQFKTDLNCKSDIINDIINEESGKAKGDKSKSAKINDNVELVDYTGRVEHIFFHPLVAYNELAFDGDYQSQGMDDWFVTVKEFKEILKQLYEKNFILVDINSLYELNTENKMVRKPIKIPKNKKPLIISIDDMNYYEYMIENGTIHKLVLDDNGKIAAFTRTKDGSDKLSYNNSIVPILDKFVEDNPDFSLNGVKATIALTGYEGILGYRTNHNNENYPSEIERVKPIVNTLKDTGWNFASHSYGHPDVATMSLNKLKRDADKWEKEVKSIIGHTEVFIYPFGSSVKYKDPKFQYLKNKGFKIFCAVGPISYEELVLDVVQTDRRHCDGISLRNQRDKFLDLYDANTVLDLEGRKQIK